MGRVQIIPENRTGEGGAGFPQVKPTEKGQKLRFTVLESPWREYVHFVKCPRFDDEGKPRMETKTRRNGDSYKDYDLEFVGKPICLGDEGTLQEKGMDEVNCPACAAAAASGGDIPGPVQRFAVNVAEYALQGNTWNIKKPFSANVKVWAFTGRIYDEIEGIQEEIGDLRKHDITLECEDPHWNRNKLGFKQEPGYKGAPSGYMKELLSTEGNKASEAQLKDACGRDVPRPRMEEDVQYAMKQWRKLRDEGSDVPEEFRSPAVSLADGIADVFGEEEAPAAEATAPAAAAGSGEDPFGEFLPEPPAPEAAAPGPDGASAPEAATAPAALPSETKADEFDFDNLLEGI